jgi:hypothetical protein
MTSVLSEKIFPERGIYSASPAAWALTLVYMQLARSGMNSALLELRLCAFALKMK